MQSKRRGERVRLADLPDLLDGPQQRGRIHSSSKTRSALTAQVMQWIMQHAYALTIANELGVYITEPSPRQSRSIWPHLLPRTSHSRHSCHRLATPLCWPKSSSTFNNLSKSQPRTEPRPLIKHAPSIPPNLKTLPLHNPIHPCPSPGTSPLVGPISPRGVNKNGRARKKSRILHGASALPGPGPPNLRQGVGSS